VCQALWRRASIYLREARRLYDEGEYDVALVMAEQAAQLALKATYARLFGYVPRGHALRRLLGYLASVLEEGGREEEAEAIRDFTSQKRQELLLLEDAYTQGRYELPGYTRLDAQKGIETASELIGLLKRVSGGSS
jgi:HEPN domain-containing protein